MVVVEGVDGGGLGETRVGNILFKTEFYFQIGLKVETTTR